MPRKAKTPAKAKAADPIDPDEFGMPPIIRTEVLSAITGLQERRLNQLITDRRIPVECSFGAGKWHTTKTLQEIFAYYQRRMDTLKPEPQRNLDVEMLKENLRAARLKNAKTARELLPRHVYVQSWGELLTVFKNRWLNFADKMAPRVFRAKDKVEAAEILDREVRDIFSSLADPKVMEDIAKLIREDEFEQGSDTHPAAGPRNENSDDLVETDA